MSETQLRDLFSRHAGTDEPPLTARFVERSIDAGRRRLRRRRAVRAATGGVAAVVALAIGVTAMSTFGDAPTDRPGQQQAVAEPRDAADLLGRISLAAARQRVDIRDDQFIHEKRQFVMRLPIPKDGKSYTDLAGESDRWVSVDGTRPGWHILPGKDGRIVSEALPATTQPSLMDPTYKYLTTLPTDPDALLAQVYAAVVVPGKKAAVERDQLAFELVGGLLNESMLPPDLGRVRFVESTTLVASALAGGVLANVASARLTYFLTVPFALLAAIAFLRFREPLLHKQTERTSLRAQVSLTWRTVTRRGALLPVVALAVLTSALLQLIFEFGPLWMVALSASALFFGPFWAAMVATLGLGGLLAGRLDMKRTAVPAAVVAAMTTAALTLVFGRGLIAVTVAQVVLALALVVVSIHVTKLVHDAVPSAVRSGVASGVSAFTWLAFVPLAAGFGLLADRVGVARAGWLIVLAVVLAGAVLVRVTVRSCGREDSNLLSRSSRVTADLTSPTVTRPL